MVTLAPSYEANYKPSEFGLIPLDWDVFEAFAFKPYITSGSRGWAKYYSEDGAPFIRITNLSHDDIYPDLSDLRFVGVPDTDAEAVRTRLQAGDVLISITADIGAIGYIGSTFPLPSYINQHIACLRLPPQVADSKYVAYFLASAGSQRRFAAMLDVGAKSGLNLTTIGKLKILCPPLSEQHAIADALGDVDELIKEFERLILKKRQIKQGAMQELLSGRRRLPGFEESWLEKTIKDIAPLQRGFDLPNSELKAGPYPVVYSNGIANYNNRFQVRGPGVVTGRSGTIGTITYVESDFWPHNTSLWVTNFNGNHPRFVFYLYTLVDFSRFASGSGVPTLNRNDAHAFIVSIPQSVDEQEAIAALLSEMDQEIDLLEERLTKVRFLKQGMMQELLTGRVRLV